MAKANAVPGVNPDDTVVANAVLILAVRISELLAWERFVNDPARVVELHEMRIAAKRLRYTLEIVAPLYDGLMDESLDNVKRIQEHLGHVHDADVLVPELEDHLWKTLKSRRKNSTISTVDGRHFDAAAGLLRLCRRKRDERTDRYEKFIALWQRLREEAFFERLRAVAQRAAADESEGLLAARAPAAPTDEPSRAKRRVDEGE